MLKNFKKFFAPDLNLTFAGISVKFMILKL